MTRTMIKAIAVLAAAGSLSYAQIYPPRKGDLAVNIGFSFEANGKRMHAGQYIVRADSERGVLFVCEDGIYCAEVEIASLKGAKTEGMRLVFTRHNGRHYLSAVMCDGGECHELPLLYSVAADDEFKSLKTREIVIHQFRGLPTSWN